MISGKQKISFKQGMRNFQTKRRIINIGYKIDITL
jgi:hypothetical protein